MLTAVIVHGVVVYGLWMLFYHKQLFRGQITLRSLMVLTAVIAWQAAVSRAVLGP